MSISIRPVGPRQPVQPLRSPDPLSPRREKEESTQSLKQERDSLQNRLLLLRESSDAAATPDVEKALSRRLEEISRRLRAETPSAAPAEHRFDRYEAGGTPGPSAGRCQIGPDGSGAPSVVFDASAEEPPSVPEGEPGVPAERTTINTDQVDRELQRLKEKRAQLRQELQSASSGQDADRLRAELAQLETDLAQKDNDAYRRQHASVSQV